MNTQKTRKQKEAENFVDEFILQHGIVPTYQEVADHFNIVKSVAYSRLRWYREKMRRRSVA